MYHPICLLGRPLPPFMSSPLVQYLVAAVGDSYRDYPRYAPLYHAIAEEEFQLEAAILRGLQETSLWG